MRLITERTEMIKVSKLLGRRVESLDEVSDPADLKRLRQWAVLPRCGECGNEVESVVEIGEEPDYESATAIICRSCLEKAIRLIDASLAVHQEKTE